jgi:phosphohistidine phosphatase
MRRLMLLRHAKAEKGSPGGRDFDRGLAPRGREESPKMGDYMAHHELNPDLVIASPARRVRETWELVAPAFRPAPPVQWEDRLYEVEAGMILKLVKAISTDARTLLLVGHNPGLQDFAKLVIASGDVEARERLNENLPTTGLLVIDFAFKNWDKLHARSGRLDRFVSPRLLTAATD